MPAESDRCHKRSILAYLRVSNPAGVGRGGLHGDGDADNDGSEDATDGVRATGGKWGVR